MGAVFKTQSSFIFLIRAVLPTVDSKFHAFLFKAAQIHKWHPPHSSTQNSFPSPSILQKNPSHIQVIPTGTYDECTTDNS